MVACPASPHEYIARLPQQGSGSDAAAGEVAEWSIAHAWKACLGLNLTRVRIPLSPPIDTEFPGELGNSQFWPHFRWAVG